MATTSGTVNSFSMTRDDVITAALRKLRVINPTQSAASSDITTGAQALNIMLKAWPTLGLYLWCRHLLQVPLVANQTSYTIGPTGSGADVIAYRPLRVLKGSYVRLNGTTPLDTPLIILSRLEYQQMSSKSSATIINSVYYDPQMGAPATAYDPTKSTGTAYFFPTPSDTTRTAYLECQRPIQEMSASGDLFDLPPEWYQALVFGLAREIADEYEVPEQRMQRIDVRWKEIVERLVDWGVQEHAPTFFQPDYQFTMSID